MVIKIITCQTNMYHQIILTQVLTKWHLHKPRTNPLKAQLGSASYCQEPE